uniref:Uncharacterized protein n=1 Tax=Anguilla anguilla TaxID=7936 RepID=A0A0E9V073_ANGAN
MDKMPFIFISVSKVYCVFFSLTSSANNNLYKTTK